MSKTILVIASALLILESLAMGADSTSIATPKSRRTAVIYSLLSTSVPLVVGRVMMNSEHSAPLGTGIATLGLILGPGTGHAYAANMRRFWIGAGTRGIVLSSTIAVAAILIHDSSGDSWEEGLPKAMLAIGAIGLGVTICFVSAIHDIATADNSVDDYNSEHGFRALTLRPIYFATHKAPGLVLKLTF
jgi:hypothetical protein